MITDDKINSSILKILDSIDTMRLGTAISCLRSFVEENRCAISIDDIDNKYNYNPDGTPKGHDEIYWTKICEIDVE